MESGISYHVEYKIGSQFRIELKELTSSKTINHLNS